MRRYRLIVTLALLGTFTGGCSKLREMENSIDRDQGPKCPAILKSSFSLTVSRAPWETSQDVAGLRIFIRGESASQTILWSAERSRFEGEDGQPAGGGFTASEFSPERHEVTYVSFAGAGTYDISVSHPDYGAAWLHDVEIKSDGCHPIFSTLRIELDR